jgi:transcriptional regulator with XRE-family HTH domain
MASSYPYAQKSAPRKGVSSSVLHVKSEAVCPKPALDFCDMGNLADRLAQAMKLRDMEVADLVRETGLSKSAIHFILNGTTKAENLRAVNLDKLSESLRVDRDWLLYGRGTPESPVPRSQSERLDADILIHADWLVHWEDEVRGVTRFLPKTDRDGYLRRLAHVYDMAKADGGRLSPAHADQIIEAAKGERNVRNTKERERNGH